MSYDSACLRRVANWSFITKNHKFDKASFNPDMIMEELDKYSPKVVALLNKIKELDDHDMMTDKKHYKHFIFSQVKQGGYGAKIIIAALLANGFNLGYDKKIKVLTDNELLKTKGKNILLLSSTPVFNNQITVKAKKDILAKYNQRPENINGDLARIIVLDGGFMEGLDLFDVKYVHIFEPQTSKADQQQAIGRATRLCGQKGLNFHPKFGWPLEVFIYDVKIPSVIEDRYKSNSLFKMFLDHSGIDQRKLAFVEELQKYAMVGAVDYELNRNVHRFALEEEDVDIQWMFEGGVAKKKAEEVACDKKCSKSRPTKDVPVSMPLFIAVHFASGKSLPDLRKNPAPRLYFCELLKNDPEFCSAANQAWKDPVKYLKDHKEEILEAIKRREHGKLPIRSRQPFLNFVFKIIEKPKVVKPPKTAKPQESVKSPQQKTATPQESVKSPQQKTATPQESVKSPQQKTATPQESVKSPQGKTATPQESVKNEKTPSIEDNIPLSEKKEDIKITTPEPPKKQMNFMDMRKYIRDNFIQYSWPKVRLENMCVPKGGSEIVKFTPTQDFVSNYFTPELPYKGMLLWHSVGTGKTCSAIATATRAFEPEGYTILWVTRTTLKSDVFKNMFDQVCNINLQEKMKQGFDIPSKNEERMRLLTKSWKIRPMSYKQFSNLVSGKNKLYQDLVAINGKEDPLRKTLLIIDEAHKLYGGADLSSVERPDMGRLHKSIMSSYETSGKDSVRLLLMTATPITNDPMELVKLLNLCRVEKDQLPDEYDDFARQFGIDESGKFTNRGSLKFLDSVAGYISYLSREKDARQFSQPTISFIEVPMSRTAFDEEKLEKIETEFTDKINDAKEEINQVNNEFLAFKKQVAENKKLAKKKCTSLKKQEKKDCQENVQVELDNLNDSLFEKKADTDKQKYKIKEDVKQIRKQMRSLLKEASEDRSQEGIIENKCFKKPKKIKNTNSEVNNSTRNSSRRN